MSVHILLVSNIFDTRDGFKLGEVIVNVLQKGIASGHFLMLQFLDLEDVYMPRLPNSIGELIHLIYLGLRQTYLKIIPSSIGNLLILQTLDLKHTYVSTLPRSTKNLQKLRHLYIRRNKITRQLSDNSMKNLETLIELFLDDDSPLMDSLHKLINPRKLQLVLNFELVTTKSMLGNYKLPSMFEVGIT